MALDCEPEDQFLVGSHRQVVGPMLGAAVTKLAPGIQGYCTHEQPGSLDIILCDHIFSGLETSWAGHV